MEAGRNNPATRALAGIVLLVIAGHIGHVVGSSLVLAEPPGPAAFLATAGIGVVCWLLGPVAVALTLRGRPLGAALYGSVGFLLALLTISDTLAFHRAVVAFGGPFDLDRPAMVLTVGGGLGLLFAAVPALRRSETAADLVPVSTGTGGRTA